MSTDTHVILVALSGDDIGLDTEALLDFYGLDTDMPLVLLQDTPPASSPTSPSPSPSPKGTEHIEWSSVIVNSGDRDPAYFRANALSILREHSNMLPIAVIEDVRRYEMMWDLPILHGAV